MDDPKKVVGEHFKAQMESWAGMYLGLPADHEFTQSDWMEVGKRFKLMLDNVFNFDELYIKLLASVPDDRLDQMYSDLNKKIVAVRKEIARRHGG
jgi:hypothetical protein